MNAFKLTNDGWMGDPSRGSAMGRSDVIPEIYSSEPKLSLRRLKWIDGDYDQGGNYWGFSEGTNIYWAKSNKAGISIFCRATSFDDARKQVLAKVPTAKFPVTKSKASKLASLDEFTQQYLGTILWAEMDESDEDGGEPLDANYTIDSFTKEALELAISDCLKFQSDNSETLARAYSEGLEVSTAGHCFWMSQTGSGVGFWDRDEISDELGNALHAASKGYCRYVEAWRGKIHLR